MRRWWIYQRERFPVLAHGVLILAFSACAVSFSGLLRGNSGVPLEGYGVAFGVCSLMFLQLRIADEFKDAEEDARWRPYRPVPRGLVKLGELRWVFVGAGVIQAVLAAMLEVRLLVPLVVAWTYLGLMSVEFFRREWLKKRPVVYLLTHMGIMPLVDFFGTACEWLPGGGRMPEGLGWFLAASFFNGIVIEIGRKLRQPGDEEEGVETYSRLWGMGGGAVVWLVAVLATFLCGLFAAGRIRFMGGFALGMAPLLGMAVVLAGGYAARGWTGKGVEKAAGVWTLGLYSLLGIVPLALS